MEILEARIAFTDKGRGIEGIKDMGLRDFLASTRLEESEDSALRRCYEQRLVDGDVNLIDAYFPALRIQEPKKKKIQNDSLPKSSE